MNKKKTYMLPNPPAPNIPIEFDESICNGCNRCVEICRNDVFMPNPEQKKPPIILYSDECWFCGCCVLECNRPGAIKLRHPLNQTLPVGWKRKDMGETYRLGMRNPPPPDTRPPSG